MKLFDKALNLHQRGFPKKAINYYLKILKNTQSDSKLLFLLGTAYFQIYKNDLAEKYLKKSLLYDKKNFLAYNNLAKVFLALNKIDDCLLSYQKSLEINKDNFGTYLELGNVYKRIKKYDEAIKNYIFATKINPNYFEAYNNLAVLYKDMGLREDSINNYKIALKINKTSYEINYNLGILYKEIFDYQKSIFYYQEAIRVNPNSFKSYNNLGNIFFRELKNYLEAENLFKKSIELNNNYLDPYYNLATMYIVQKKYKGALEYFEKVKKINPEYDFIDGRILYTKLHLSDWKNFDQLSNQIIKGLNKNKKIIHPFEFLLINDDQSLNLKCSEIYVNNLFEKKIKFTKTNKKQNVSKTKNKYKIAYFSSDLRDHAVFHLIQDIFKNHDKSKFQIYAFSYGPKTFDKFVEKIKKYFNKFIDINHEADEDVAKMCRNLDIDIAIDLNGFTEYSRTGIFFYRAAPIQINYLGYPGTMGTNFIDYIIADKTIIQENDTLNYKEKILYLPNCYQPNKKFDHEAKNKFDKRNFTISPNKFVFCCLNKNLKYNPMIFKSWMNILKNTNNSVLWLLVQNEGARRNLKKEIEKNKVDLKRIEFLDRASTEKHFERLLCSDIFLDTFPYNAHTTASESIRAGTPVITLKGNSFASRVASSVLEQVNMHELIANNIQDYEEIAIELANNQKKYSIIQKKLIDNLETSSLFSPEFFTKSLENLYLKLLEKN